MKHFELDWQQIFERLATWEELAPASRDVLQEAHAATVFELAVFGADAGPLADARILQHHKDGRRTAAHPDARAFLSTMRALRRVPLAAEPRLHRLAEYLADVFTVDERSGLVSAFRPTWREDFEIARTLTTESHVRGFLEAKSVHEWEVRHQPDTYRAYRNDKAFASYSFGRPNVVEATREILRALMARPEPVPLRDVPELSARHELATVARAVQGLVRYALAFPAERPGDQVPILMLWPPLSARLHRTKAEPPERVEPHDARSTAFGIDDVVTLLLAAAREPLRLRASDGEIFEKRAREIDALFVRQPKFIELAFAKLSEGAPWRLAQARRTALAMDWLSLSERAAAPTLEVSIAGHEWLALAENERSKLLIDQIRASGELTEEPSERTPTPVPHFGAVHLEEDLDDDDDEWNDRFGGEDWSQSVSFLPAEVSSGLFSDAELVRHLVTAFESIPRDAFVDLGAFLRHRTERANPLCNEARIARERAKRQGVVHTDEDLEADWERALTALLFERLLPFGIAAASEHGDDHLPCIALTPLAPYVFGRTADWPELVTRREAPAAIVQPNFEVVFPRPAPSIEARLAAFAERLEGATTKLRLTRAAVHAAAASGTSADNMVATLREVALHPVPTNVERELRSWAKQVHHVEVEHVPLVRCSDHDLALRVVAAIGPAARLHGDRVVELPSGALLNAAVRKLRQQGLFARVSGSSPKRRRP